jgi:hypothetical protein
MPYRPGEMRALNLPAPSLYVSLMTRLAPSRSNEMTAPETGLPLLSSTAPVIGCQICFARGRCRRFETNCQRDQHKRQPKNSSPHCPVAEITHRHETSSRVTLDASEVTTCDCVLVKIGRKSPKDCHVSRAETDVALTGNGRTGSGQETYRNLWITRIFRHK